MNVSQQMRRMLLGVALVFGASLLNAGAALAQQLEANKRNVVEFYDLALNKKDFAAASK